MAAMEKARFYDLDKPGAFLYVPFNPNTLELSYQNNLKAHKNVANQKKDAADYAQAGVTGAPGAATLSVRLFYHSYKDAQTYADVREEIAPLCAFLRRTDAKGKGSSRKIGFAWGTLIHEGTLESLSIHYQMFAPDGTPVQAEVSLSIYGGTLDDKMKQASGAPAPMEKKSANYEEKPLNWLNYKYP